MTEPDNKPERDRPENESGEPQIEVTPEMIEAGVKALQAWSSTDEYFDVGAISVYRAMQRARLARGSGGSLRKGAPMHGRTHLSQERKRKAN